MKFQITGKNIKITEAMKDVTEQKLSKMDKYFIIDESVTAKVLARTYKNEQKINSLFTLFTYFLKNVILKNGD